MLVLSRKKTQALTIGGNIRVVILRSCRSKVVVGIDAPDHIQIQRDEASSRLQPPESVCPETESAARILQLENALRNIIKHQELIGGSLADHSTVRAIAKSALNASP